MQVMQGWTAGARGPLKQLASAYRRGYMQGALHARDADDFSGGVKIEGVEDYPQNFGGVEGTGPKTASPVWADCL